MATEAVSAAACSEPRGRFACVLVDPARNATRELAVPAELGPNPTVRDVVALSRTDCGPELERQRFADGLFPLTDDGTLGELIRGLRFRIGGRACGLDHRLAGGPVRIEIDRSQTGYTRNWPAFLARRWNLRADAYSRFVASVIENAYPGEAESVLRLDAPDRIRRFLAAVARRIYAAPYETYSRYLDSGAPFKGPDQALDRILEGDGGNCAEKAMAFYFIARAYGIPAEVVLGGEDAAGKFPFRALRSILDERAFGAEATRDAQRYWQHYAVLCRPSPDPRDDVLCDVAGSNIPFLFLGADEASKYLGSEHRAPLQVVITLDPIALYYHRLAHRQDLPLDLYYAMEHFIESIDVIHTVDNELGLLHTGDYWVGVIAHRSRRAFGRIVSEYERYVSRAGLGPRTDLCFVPDLAPARHPLLDRFLRAYPSAAERITAADPRIRKRLSSTRGGSRIHYVVLRLTGAHGAS